MKITDALLGEHGAFYAQFDLLDRLVPSVDLEAVHALGRVLGAALATHAAIENDLLLSALEEGDAVAGPAAEMRREHDDIEQLLESVISLGDVEAAQDAMLDCIALARAHFGREEAVLFPAAEILGSERLTELGRAWAARRRVMIEGG
jgi:hemerythrin-like domain-containing protein